jgi:hypothetical protein
MLKRAICPYCRDETMIVRTLYNCITGVGWGTLEVYTPIDVGNSGNVKKFVAITLKIFLDVASWVSIDRF